MVASFVCAITNKDLINRHAFGAWFVYSVLSNLIQSHLTYFWYRLSNFAQLYIVIEQQIKNNKS